MTIPRLRLIFTGLLGYVESQVGDKKKLTVLFTALPIPEMASSRDPNQRITLPHFSFMSFSAAQLGESTRLPEVVFKKYGESEFRYGLFLGKEVVTIETGAAPSGVSFYRHPDIGDDHPNKPDNNLPGEVWIAQRKDYRWILSMDKALPGCGRVDADCLRESISEMTSARIEIFDGEVTVNRLVGEIDLGGGKRDANLYRFAPMDGAPEVIRALAEEVAVDIPITNADGEVRFLSKPLSGGKDENPLTLKANGRDIECYFFNVELDQIIRPRELVFDSRSARDFIALYDLAQYRPPARRRRFPSVYGTSVGPAGDRICPGGRFYE